MPGLIAASSVRPRLPPLMASHASVISPQPPQSFNRLRFVTISLPSLLRPLLTIPTYLQSVTFCNRLKPPFRSPFLHPHSSISFPNPRPILPAPARNPAPPSALPSEPSESSDSPSPTLKETHHSKLYSIRPHLHPLSFNQRNSPVQHLILDFVTTLPILPNQCNQCNPCFKLAQNRPIFVRNRKKSFKTRSFLLKTAKNRSKTPRKTPLFYLPPAQNHTVLTILRKDSRPPQYTICNSQFPTPTASVSQHRLLYPMSY